MCQWYAHPIDNQCRDQDKDHCKAEVEDDARRILLFQGYREQPILLLYPVDIEDVQAVANPHYHWKDEYPIEQLHSRIAEVFLIRSTLDESPNIGIGQVLPGDPHHKCGKNKEEEYHKDKPKPIKPPL